EKQRRPAVLALGQLCRHVEDEVLAADLLAVALDGIREKKERLRLTGAAVEFLREAGQFNEAERLLQPLLDDAELGKRAALWRLAPRIASDPPNAPPDPQCLVRSLPPA